MDRYGLKTNTIDKIDALTYTYMPFSNKLLSVSDAASSAGFNNGSTETLPDYNYDLNGNLTSDANKRITSITYNYLDLPVTVQKSSSVYINYVYNAGGGKVEKKYSDGESITTTQYANGFVYQNGTLQYFPHTEGYVQKDSNGNFVYVYQYKDHLGNVRLSYFKNTATNALEVVEEENYYAFGMKHQGYNNVTSSNANNVAQKIEFNGKEYQDELSLNWYDYGARNYDPTVGRWFNVDPLAEKYRKWTPYNYCMNNPVYFTDPDGMSADKRDYDGAAAAELVTQMQANLERRQRQQYVFNTYGWPSGFDSFTGINNMGNGGGGVGLGQLLEFTEGIPDSSVKVGPLGNAEMQNATIEDNGSVCDVEEIDPPKSPPTRDEANVYWASGKGGVYYIDASKVDLNFLALKVKDWKVGQIINVQTLYASKHGSVFGQLNLQYIGNNQVTVQDDAYDFDMKPWDSLGNIKRNIFNIIGKISAGEGIPFTFRFVGVNTITPRLTSAVHPLIAYP